MKPHSKIMAFGFATGLAVGACGTESEGGFVFRGDAHGDDGNDGDDDKDKGCVRTMGYYKTHNAYRNNPDQSAPWPISEDTWACGATWLEWLWEPPRGDATIILAHQWITAALNEASGAWLPWEVEVSLTRGVSLLADCEITAGERAEAIELAELLDDYNNGGLGVPHCDEDEHDGGDDGGDDGKDDDGNDDDGGHDGPGKDDDGSKNGDEGGDDCGEDDGNDDDGSKNDGNDDGNDSD